jgi:hypothetical protein
MRTNRTLKLEIVDPTGVVIDDMTQTIDFYVGTHTGVTITIGDNKYFMDRDGKIINHFDTRFIPYD